MKRPSSVETFKWVLFALVLSSVPACSPGSTASQPAPSGLAVPTPNKSETKDEDPALTERLRTLAQRAGGTVGIAVIHIETGRSVNIESDRRLPLYSVFKMPLAVSVLKDVEEGRLRLDTRIRVTPADIVPGTFENTALWRRPVGKTIKELLQVSISRSDNTSSDKLLQLVGGPESVTRRMRALGYTNIDIHSTIREYVDRREKVNSGSAGDLARLLTELQSGRILKQPELDILRQFMRQAITGQRRLRGDLPAGTEVADKTGSGEAGEATNDVGIIKLPQDRGHLAMAVLISGSKLPVAAQEELIAELARVAYDAYVSRHP